MKTRQLHCHFTFDYLCKTINVMLMCIEREATLVQCNVAAHTRTVCKQKGDHSFVIFNETNISNSAFLAFIVFAHVISIGGK